MQPLEYERINQDMLKTVSYPTDIHPPVFLTLYEREKCLKVADELLSDGKSIVVGTWTQISHLRCRTIDRL